LKERTEKRQGDLLAGYRAQLKAIHRWGLQPPADLSVIRQPTLVANGDHDRMVATKTTVDLNRRLPNIELVMYPDAGHGDIFQDHREFVETQSSFSTGQPSPAQSASPARHRRCNSPRWKGRCRPSCSTNSSAIGRRQTI
jgi:hypothetical protein